MTYLHRDLSNKEEPQLLVMGTTALVILCGAPCRLRYGVRLPGAGAMYGCFGPGGLLPLRLQLVVGLVCLKGSGGEAVVLPPRDQRGNGGDASGDQLLHGLALDGQRALAQCRQHLIGQGQQQAGGAGNGACGDGGCVVGVCVHSQFLSPGSAGLAFNMQFQS